MSDLYYVHYVAPLVGVWYMLRYVVRQFLMLKSFNKDGGVYYNMKKYFRKCSYN